MKHPNATTAGGTTGIGVLAVWLLGNVFHLDISAELGAAVAGTAATIVLFIGRRGIRGAVTDLWNGRPGTKR